MASNKAQFPDLRTTIPLAAKTLIRRVGKPRRSWLVPALTALAGMALALMLLELAATPSPASALAYEGELRSQLVANYGKDPITSRVHELRLSLVDEVLGGGDAGDNVAALAPVPSVTPEPTRAKKERATESVDPSATPSATPLPAVTELPAPSATEGEAGTMGSGVDCSRLSIGSIWFHDDDEIRATVRNDLHRDAYLSYTVLEWPDLPGSTYVDYFRFDDSRYYNHNDYSSPTAGSSWERLRHGQSETWRVDFDHEPEVGIFGHFGLSLKFTIPSLEASCTLDASLFKPIPPGFGPSPTPSDTPVLADTVTPTASEPPVPTATAAPTDMPEPTATGVVTSTPAPTEPPPATDTAEPTAEPTQPPTPTETPPPTATPDS